VPATLNRVGSMLTGFFTAGPVIDYATALTCDTARYARVHAGLLSRGVFFAPSQFEAVFVSLAHNEQDIDATVAAFSEAVGSRQ
jgi:glutamate-1-semialdehyde 2,1-aminomutase